MLNFYHRFCNLLVQKSSSRSDKIAFLTHSLLSLDLRKADDLEIPTRMDGCIESSTNRVIFSVGPHCEDPNFLNLLESQTLKTSKTIKIRAPATLTTANCLKYRRLPDFYLPGKTRSSATPSLEWKLGNFPLHKVSGTFCF